MSSIKSDTLSCSCCHLYSVSEDSSLSCPPAVSFDELMASTAKPKQQQQQVPSQQGDVASSQEPQQAAAAALDRVTGGFMGSASQQRPIPLHVLDQEYDMVHQVCEHCCGNCGCDARHVAHQLVVCHLLLLASGLMQHTCVVCWFVRPHT